MRYIIQHTSAAPESSGVTLSTYAAELAASAQDAEKQFLAKRPDRRIIKTFPASDRFDAFSLYGMGACTDAEQAAIRHNLSRKMDDRRAEEQRLTEIVSAYTLEEFAARVAYEERRASGETQNADGVFLGDLFSCSWGYEQTNVDYYQVVALHGAHTVVLRRNKVIRREILDSMTGLVRPIRDRFDEREEPHTLRTKTRGGQLQINAPHGCGNLERAQDGEIGHFTAYA